MQQQFIHYLNFATISIEKINKNTSESTSEVSPAKQLYFG